MLLSSISSRTLLNHCHCPPPRNQHPLPRHATVTSSPRTGPTLLPTEHRKNSHRILVTLCFFLNPLKKVVQN